MIGLLLAAVFGSLQLYLLIVALRPLAQGRVHIAALVGQFFCPMVGLLLCALLAKGQLVVCAVGICVILIAGALFRFCRSRTQDRHNQEKRD